jgi:hypothetical protein
MKPFASVYRIFQSPSADWCHPGPAHNDREVSGSLPRTPSPRRPFARRPTNRDAAAWLGHSLPLYPEAWRATVWWFYRHPVAAARPFCRCPSAESFHGAPSLPDFPCSPSVTRSVLLPRPSALGVLLRATTPAGQVRTCRGPRQDVRPSGLGFQRKNLPAASALAGEIFVFEASAERHAFGLGSGAPHVASRRSVPRAIRANPNQEKLQWHFMKTTSR